METLKEISNLRLYLKSRDKSLPQLSELSQRIQLSQRVEVLYLSCNKLLFWVTTNAVELQQLINFKRAIHKKFMQQFTLNV